MNATELRETIASGEDSYTGFEEVKQDALWERFSPRMYKQFK